MTFPTATTIAAALAVIPAAVAAYTKLTEVLRPLLQRRKASQVAPEATLLVLTYDALQGLPRGPKWLLCNSPVRLRGDLAAIAESTP